MPDHASSNHYFPYLSIYIKIFEKCSLTSLRIEHCDHLRAGLGCVFALVKPDSGSVYDFLWTAVWLTSRVAVFFCVKLLLLRVVVVDPAHEVSVLYGCRLLALYLIYHCQVSLKLYWLLWHLLFPFYRLLLLSTNRGFNTHLHLMLRGTPKYLVQFLSHHRTILWVRLLPVRAVRGKSRDGLLHRLSEQVVLWRIVWLFIWRIILWIALLPKDIVIEPSLVNNHLPFEYGLFQLCHLYRLVVEKFIQIPYQSISAWFPLNNFSSGLPDRNILNDEGYVTNNYCMLLLLSVTGVDGGEQHLVARSEAGEELRGLVVKFIVVV